MAFDFQAPAGGGATDHEENIPMDVDRHFHITAYGPGVAPVEYTDRLRPFLDAFGSTVRVVYFNGSDHFSRCPTAIIANGGEEKDEKN